MAGSTLDQDCMSKQSIFLTIYVPPRKSDNDAQDKSDVNCRYVSACLKKGLRLGGDTSLTSASAFSALKANAERLLIW